MRRTAAALLGLLVACSDGGTAPSVAIAPDTTLAAVLPQQPPPPPGELVGLTAVELGRFEEPTWVGSPPGDDRVFVIEKRGVVSVLDAGSWHTYLDWGPFVSSDGPELGMVGMAFHPGFAANGRFFILFTDEARDTAVMEFGGSLSRSSADPTEPLLVFAADQPQEWHNGGHLEFGPDGYLWISLGDGGGIGDQYENAQDPGTPLGALLRIDVNAGRPYAIPPGNPFVDGGGAPEVWVYGLRNPYRFHVDPVDRLLYIADVGQERWEEINVVGLAEPGHNFGWPVTEGFQCYVDILLDPEPASVPCDDSGFTDPVLTYAHGPACAIIGGPVYRGQAIPELYGHYVYADWCAGFVRSVRVDDRLQATERADWSEDLGGLGRVFSVGTDGWGELLVATADAVYRIEPRR